MNIMTLYKKHINENPSLSEIHFMHSNFRLTHWVIPTYDPDLEKDYWRYWYERYHEAEMWILKNSKLKI